MWMGFALLASVAAGALAQTSPAPSGFNLFSVQQDAEIGKKSADQIERQIPVLSTPEASRLVSRLGQRLAAHASGPSFSYRFKVVNLSDINAFALPGGYVYIHRGLIERVRTEGELAGVMAHEIAHVALRHPTRQLTKGYAAQAGASLLLGLIGGGTHGRTSQVVNALGGFGLNALMLKYSRSAEDEADAMGARIMARAGYDPAEMASFFSLLRSEAGSSRVATFLSSHPSPASREAHIRAEAASYGPVARTRPIGNLRAAQAELKSLAPAPRMSKVTGTS